MAKKDFRQDTEDIFGLDRVKKDETARAVLQAEAHQEPKAKSEPAASDKLTLKSYYLTPKLYKALKLRSAMSDKPEDKDLSAIVRAALTVYLKEELEKV